MKALKALLLGISINLFACQPNDRGTSTDHSITLTNEVLKDKIKGAWAAQTIGVTFGRPVEFQYNSTRVPDYYKIDWTDSSIEVEFRDRPGTYDDIYMDLSFMEVIEDKGIDASANDFADSFAHADYELWFANQTGRYNILQGLEPPESGHWLNNPCADDIDFQIEADFAGLMSPGMINSAVKICDRVGHIMNYGDGYYGGVFVAGMYSQALISDSPENILDIIETALKVIPAESKFSKCISDVLKWYKEDPINWKLTWHKTSEKWGEDIGSPLGVFRPFNIDAKINAAWVTIGLLYGKGDFTRTFEIATRCGDDADCNPGTAGGILAAIVGFEKIPAGWKSGLEKVEKIPFIGTKTSLLEAYDMSLSHAMQMITKNGGMVREDEVEIVTQEPKGIPLEVAFDGHYPVQKIIPKRTNDSIWFEFEGIGYAVAGPYDNPDYGDKSHVFEAQVFINGQMIEKALFPTKNNHRRYTPFWKYQLPRGKHRVAIKIVNPVDWAKVDIRYAIIYDDKPNLPNF